MSSQELPDGAGYPGPQPRLGGGGGGIFPLSNLPRDILISILEQLRPSGSLTTYESTAKKAVVRASHVQCRTSLMNVCLASKELHGLAIPSLYHNSFVKNQRELFYFFSALLRRPDRRPMVRSFAWVGGLWEDDANNPESSTALSRKGAMTAADYWSIIKDEWPREGVGHDIAETMGINGPDDLKDWRLLGAVLAMCPRIKRLFMLNEAVVDPGNFRVPCPEVEAISPFFTRPKEVTGRVRPYSHLLLQDLEVLSFKTPHQAAASFNTEFILTCMLMNSPKLRRVELKQSPNFRIITRNTQRTVGTPHNMKELLLFSGYPLEGDMAAIASAFPKLVSLRVEFKDTLPLPSSLFLPRGTSEALLNFSETLETLSLTTSPKSNISEGDWVHSNSYTSSLSTLNQMAKLKDLTTESIWLFGTRELDTALQLSQLLPPSLVRLHLIDRWGASEPAHFYPGFPESWSPIQFYERVVQALCKECHIYFSGLREVTIASSYLHSHAQATTPCNALLQDETGTIQAHLQNFKESLDKFGVKLSIVAPEESTSMVHSNWANIG